MNQYDNVDTSLITSEQADCPLVGCRKKFARLSFSIFHCFYLAQNLLSTKTVADMSQIRFRPARSISTCRDRSSRSATCLRLFLSKQVLSNIETVEFRNDKRTDFSRQSTNQQPFCYDVINDDINDVPHNADHRLQPSRLATCYTHYIVASSACSALPKPLAAFY